MSNDDLIYVAVVNPPGEKNGDITEFMEENQLIVAAKELPGIPVFINHNSPNNLKVAVEPSGVVVSANVDNQGRLIAAFKLNDSKNGKLAKTLVGEDGTLPEELRMQQVSLGYGLRSLPESNIPQFHQPQELSICFEGARPGTEILGAVSESTIKQQYDEEVYKGLEEVHKTLQIIY